MSLIYTNYIVPAVTSRPVVIGAGCLGAIPAIDLAVCAYQDLSGLLHTPYGPETDAEKEKRLARREKMKDALLVRGVGALILGACAANQFPGSGIAGLAGFMIYARFAWTSEKTQPHLSPTTVIIGAGLKVLSIYKTKIAVSIGSAFLTAGAWTASSLHGIALRVLHAGRAILHGIHVAGRAAGRFCHAVVLVPIRGLITVFKVAAKILYPLVRHPVLGVGVLAGTACLIGCIKYGNLLAGASQTTARLISKIARGLRYAVPPVLQGTLKGVKLLGRALYFLPSGVIKTVNVIRTIVHFIFHPFQGKTSA